MILHQVTNEQGVELAFLLRGKLKLSRTSLLGAGVKKDFDFVFLIAEPPFAPIGNGRKWNDAGGQLIKP